MRKILKILRCDTVEKCRRIQAGCLPLRRLGKWSVLFTIAFTLWLSDALSVCIDRIFTKQNEVRGQYIELREQYVKATGSVFYRWTIGWFVPALEPPNEPKLDARAIALYRLVNAIQLFFFVMICIYCMRWVYADFIASGNPVMFLKFCIWATMTNIAFYFILRILTSQLLNQLLKN